MLMELYTYVRSTEELKIVWSCAVKGKMSDAARTVRLGGENGVGGCRRPGFLGRKGFEKQETGRGIRRPHCRLPPEGRFP